MTPYQLMVKALVKPGAAILAELTPLSTSALHNAVGVAGEAGELLDALKKHAVYNKPLDRDNVVEELGDIEFYLEGLRQDLGITRDDTLIANMTKLSRRYPGLQFTNEAAQARADKQEDTFNIQTIDEAKPRLVNASGIVCDDDAPELIP